MSEVRPPPTDVRSALADEHAELAARLEAMGATDWQLPTRCEGWDVSDVVLHLAQTDELASATLGGRFQAVLSTTLSTSDATAVDSPTVDVTTVDDAAAALVARERDIAPGALLERWRNAAAALRTGLESADMHRRVPWVSGELTVQTLATTRLAETWIHAGDVSDALGASVEPTERLRHVARLAWRTLPYAFARAGRRLQRPVAFELRGPSGDAWEFRTDDEPGTVVHGDGVELCMVAARRLGPSETSLEAEGPDAGSVLELVRTYA